MPRAINLNGHRYGRLTVVAFAGTIDRERHWKCRCDCGNVTIVIGNAMRRGNTLSCGCLRLERISTHRLSSSPEYSIWKAARNRCHNQGSQGYENYGGRGIQMCERWRHSFAAFIEDMGRRPSPEHSINRINNDGPYAPDNCEWATRKVQSSNRRGNHIIDFRGERLTVTEWAGRIGMSARALLSRLEYGWTVEESLTTPPDRIGNRHGLPRLTLNGVTRTRAEWARKLGMRSGSLKERLERWPVEQALTEPKRRH